MEIPAITLICYLGGMGVSLSRLDNKWIPLLCGLLGGALGGALGVLAMGVMPDFPAANLIDALAVGIASGLAATGADQAIRQLGDWEEEQE